MHLMKIILENFSCQLRQTAPQCEWQHRALLLLVEDIFDDCLEPNCMNTLCVMNTGIPLVGLCFWRVADIKLFLFLRSPLEPVFVCSRRKRTEGLLSCFYFVYFIFLDKISCTQASLELPSQPRMTLNLWSSCLHILGAGITGMFHHIWFYVVWWSELRAFWMQVRHFTN